MSRAPWTVVIDAQRVCAYAAGRGDAPVLVTTASWVPDAPERTIDTLAALADRPASIVLMIGLAWLEFARPALPPVSISVKRRILSIEGDRWFPFASRPATTVLDDLVLAMPEEQLERWRAAFERIAPVVAITTAVHAARLSGETGALSLDAAPGEYGLVQVEGGRLVGVRRTRAQAEANARSLAPERLVQSLQRLARGGEGIPTDMQLLGVAAEEREHSRHRARWWRAGVVCAAAALFALWSFAVWRERSLEAFTREAMRLEVEAVPALDAMTRLDRAREESRRLSAPIATSPSEVLAILSEVLPKDVFVQRAERDGAGWRIDGSASDAAALIPRLDAHASLRNVRSLAPSSRFVDGGRQRSSFSIGFDVERAP